ncbi:MAG: hypothetical protein JWQ02_1276 [Capsulimonas sp.]|nr:hypothetical protein [Capsulimonas sp.]
MKIKLLRALLASALFGASVSICSAKDFAASQFGVSAGGATLNTRSIQFAIDYISQSGGGRLVFSSGRYLTGTIHLKSDVTLQLEEGAVLLGSTNPFDYDHEDVPFDYNKTTSTSLIFGKGLHDIGITGPGTVDGQGAALAENVADYARKGFINDPLRGRPSEDHRPMLINLYSCDRVTLNEVTLKDSSCWVQMYNQCRHVDLDHIRVISRAFWNNDGVDIVDCDDFKVSNSSFDCSDDGICLKSIDPQARCQHIWIRNNSVTSDASGIKFGTASFGGFNDVHVLQNRVYNTYRGAIALETVDGGYLEDVEVDGLQAVNVGNAIFLRAGARLGARKGRLENVRIKNVSVEIGGKDVPRTVAPVVVIAGLPDIIVSNVKLENIVVKAPGGGDPAAAKITLDNLSAVPENPSNYPEFSMFGELPAWGVYMRHAQGIQFSGLTLSCAQPDYRTTIVLDDVHQSGFKNLRINGAAGKKKNLHASHSSEIAAPKK